MSSSVNISQINAIIAEALPHLQAGAIEPDAPLFELGLDSISAMSLIMRLQSDFGIALDPQDLNLENFRSPACITDFIQRKQTLASS